MGAEWAEASGALTDIGNESGSPIGPNALERAGRKESMKDSITMNDLAVGINEVLSKIAGLPQGAIESAQANGVPFTAVATTKAFGGEEGLWRFTAEIRNDDRSERARIEQYLVIPGGWSAATMASKKWIAALDIEVTERFGPDSVAVLRGMEQVGSAAVLSSTDSKRLYNADVMGAADFFGVAKDSSKGFEAVVRSPWGNSNNRIVNLEHDPMGELVVIEVADEAQAGRWSLRLFNDVKNGQVILSVHKKGEFKKEV